MSDALVLEGVSKRYSGHVAVDELSLNVPTGTIYGILGPNGAGKSTTLRMVMNIILRDEGRISLHGADPERDRGVLRKVGYLPEERGLYRKMKVLDVVVFFARLKGVDAPEAKRRGEEWLERMGLADWRDAKVETLSKGMQQKVQFITTVLHDPELLILDEPQSGLDPVNQDVLRETILDARNRGRTVILSTHNMDQAERMCESVCIIAAGRKVLDGRVRDVRRENRGNRFRVAFDERSPEVDRFMAESGGVLVTERQSEVWEIERPDGVDPNRLLSELAALGVPVTRFEHVEPSLHEIFVQQVGNASIAARRPEPVHV